MKYFKVLWLLACCITSGIAFAQSSGSVATESRDQALSYLGTTNFIVGRVGSECLATLGRSETPRQFVGAWQQRNSRYLHALDIYMGMRLKEAEESGGKKKREALYQAMIAPARASGAAVVDGWFRQDGKEKACERSVALIEAGGFDVSPKVPLYSQLEELSGWAKKYQTGETGFKVKGASFGLFGLSGKELKFTPATVVPFIPDQQYGWVINLQTDKKSIKWREEMTLPAKPSTWGDPLSTDSRKISKDGRISTIEREVPVDNGVIYNVWAVAPGDPKGHYTIRVSIDQAQVASFEFDVR